jgi:hypothetical protein
MLTALRPYAKGIVAGVGAVATVLIEMYGADSTAGKIAGIVIAALTVAGVYRVPNTPAPVEKPPTP